MYIIVLFFVIGLFVGSFLNVVIDRLPRGEIFHKGRSHCESCHRTLQWYDLIPLISFISLGGKCRYCHRHIGWQALVVELLTGFLFALTAYMNPISIFALTTSILTLVYAVFMLSCFIIITFIDSKHGIIPNKIVYSGLIITLLYHLFFPTSFINALLSGIAAGLFFFFLFAITKGCGMGFGDVKLALLLGLFLGFPNIVIALYIAFLTGAIVALILVIGKKKNFSGGTIPFGPFLVFGATLAFLYGNTIWEHLHIFSFF